jgi:signal transduction histidine kinase
MVTDLRVKLTYRQRLFLLLSVFAWLLIACFLVFQYHREKQYKIESLNAQLQVFNRNLLEDMEDGDTLSWSSHQASYPLGEIRISVIDETGRPVFDNTLDTLPSGSYNDRHEISQAIKNGSGYTVRRVSQTNQQAYFYSATSDGRYTVRSAVPYAEPLQGFLEADSGFLWFLGCMLVVINITAYMATRGLGQTITRLNLFAARAERGEPIYDMEAFPADELGSISSNIVRLYARLQKTIAERDREHLTAIREEKEKIRIKRQLTNNLNHELKTPVSSMLVCLETLIDHPEIPETKRDEFLRRCHANTLRLSSLLTDISTITRLDEGQHLISTSQVDITATVKDIAADAAQRLAAAAMTINVDIPDGVVVEGNQRLIESVFRNLIDNAIAYSAGTRVDIVLQGETSGRYFFSVADDGMGIAPEHWPMIFDRFYRVDKGRSRNMGGTGLGLSIVKNAINFHGGEITVGTSGQGGARFDFSLSKKPPLKADATAP